MIRRLFVLGGAAGATFAGYHHYNKPFTHDNRFDQHVELEGAFSPETFKAYKLKEITPLSHDTSIYTFALEDTKEDNLTVPYKMNVPVASCIVAKAQVADEVVVRPYTPINKSDDVGKMELLVKSYPTGKLSKHFSQLAVGDQIEFKGPFVKIDYKPNYKKEMAFIVGGTGITPAYQIIQRVLSQTNEDKTKLTLLYASRTPEDILLKKELDTLAKKYPQQFKIYYTVDSDPNQKADSSIQGRGFVNKEMIEKAGIPKPSEDVLVSVCGPMPFYDMLSGRKKSPQEQGELSGLLKQMGYDEKTVYKF
ncbi:predicted protein [Naegleria gruberi]|uniref:NADH-cytochrome b5 reductase n=1 Tax=Naegleria gruberi TaxID=5762 RepID=D2VTA3_NAEGR|nr:uncharacterized protein NAEGRDRAFT_60853 [Naegleria gruberi]EFC39823.1 predicted protein [Naegleria gruberi]|eukprot:XP_002672567.1 predicted protein [Naegleria gruberi strain NEG-M]